MILIGQFDSPFVRRVGIALTLYGMAFDHRTFSAFGDADRIRPFNPLVRVPTLVLEGGESLIDSHMILDHLDGLVPAADRLFPIEEPQRRRALRTAALACGAGDKAVSLFYELRLHQTASEVFVRRCLDQIGGALAELDADLARQRDPFWHGARAGHADIAVACVWRFMAEALAGTVDLTSYSRLADLSARLEATAPFIAVRQPFIAPT